MNRCNATKMEEKEQSISGYTTTIKITISRWAISIHSDGKDVRKFRNPIFPCRVQPILIPKPGFLVSHAKVRHCAGQEIYKSGLSLNYAG